jgi:adenylate cyclase
VCGGRGRCSTCRIVVGDGLQELPPPTVEEARVLARIAAAPDVRLACQLAPIRDVAVTLVVGPTRTARRHAAAESAAGEEREIAVLFADLPVPSAQSGPMREEDQG